MINDEAMETLFGVVEGISKNNRSPIIGIGKVLSTEPLRIKYNDLILEKEELWINEYLWKDHRREAKGTIKSGTLEVNYPPDKRCPNKSCKQSSDICPYAANCTQEHEERKKKCIPELCPPDPSCHVGVRHTHPIDNFYTDEIIYTDTDLKPGFYVAIMPTANSTDGTKQQYIVLCHIFRLDGKYKE